MRQKAVARSLGICTRGQILLFLYPVQASKQQKEGVTLLACLVHWSIAVSLNYCLFKHRALHSAINKQHTSRWPLSMPSFL